MPENYNAFCSATEYSNIPHKRNSVNERKSRYTKEEAAFIENYRFFCAGFQCNSKILPFLSQLSDEFPPKLLHFNFL